MKALNPQRIYAISMWLVSIVFASFLIGLGNLVIADLPKYGQAEQLEELGGQSAQPKQDEEDRQLAIQIERLQTELKGVEALANNAQQEYDLANDAHQNWLRTREVTASSKTAPDQDKELIERTRNIQEKADARVQMQHERDGVAYKIDQLEQKRKELHNQKYNSDEAVAERRSNELKAFGLRLALTLPLLLASALMIARQRKSAYWPLYRGFVIFSAFAFFFELVPYLPSYGGYVREVVGIVVCLVGGHHGIRWMQGYLQRREEMARRDESERRQSMDRETAMKKMAAGLCPGCDRAIATPIGEEQVNHCVHCGLKLFDHCAAPGCGTRKNAYFAYCQSCGTGAQPHIESPQQCAQS